MNDTMSEFERILADLYEKTGTDVRLSPDGKDAFLLNYRGKSYAVRFVGGGTERERALVQYALSGAETDAFSDREEELKNILFGEGNGWQVFRFMTRRNLSDGACCALDVVPEKLLPEAAAHIARCIEGTKDMSLGMDESRIAVVKFSGDEQTPFEFGQFLSQSLYEELGIRASIGIGCEVKSFADIARSYRQAATAVRMSGIFHGKGEVHTYREYLLVRMLEDVPKHRLKEYLEQFGIGNGNALFGDGELTETAEEFLESDLNVSETSRNLYMHRNTLMYRLDKIEHISGLNIRKFTDAVTFRVISILYRLLNQ